MPAVLRRAARAAVDPAWGVLPDAAGRLLRGDRFAARDRLALCGQSLAGGVFGLRTLGADAGPLVSDAGAAAAAGGGSPGGVRSGRGNRQGEGPSEGEDLGCGLDDAGGECGDEIDRPPGHGRELEGIRAASGGGGRDRGSERRRSSQIRPEAAGEEGFERRVGLSPSDPDARLTKMKDGRTRFAYKAQHALDLESEILVGVTVHRGDEPDGETLKAAIEESVRITGQVGASAYAEVVADRGYHKTETLAWLEDREVRSYIPEPRRQGRRRWRDKPAGWERAYRNNRRRGAGARARRLHRLRSERVERSFAHTCRSGGARRTWLRGLANVLKRYLIQAAGRNLGTLMRHCYGVGTPRGLAALAGRLRGLIAALMATLRRLAWAISGRTGFLLEVRPDRHPVALCPALQGHSPLGCAAGRPGAPTSTAC
ncbi:MAG: IS4/IS5 family transposase [Caldilineae bacterium]|nr:MAG: IS4/IS5 family transposase [Caldilineae bacterium]